MEKDDVELIRSILSGDDTAFSSLVQKHQKSVHALAWRKIGDFQIAEEITQDAFLHAYKKLATLKNPNQFAGWLYVIASNLCTDWHRRKKPTMQSLEGTNTRTLEKTAYQRYVAEQREKAAAEHRCELVKSLLDKLPESERTVVTLHYLGEMTSEAISKFLGVSVNTIKSRLRRARKRLEKEEPMIRETLSSVQLPANFTENIMKQVENIKPTSASSGKPLIPWAALGSAAVLMILLLGASSQYLTRFQKPYNLEAQSETSIEIVDAPVMLDIQSKPDLQHQVSNGISVSKNGSNVEQNSDAVLAVDAEENSPIAPVVTHQWTQAMGPRSTEVRELFVSSKGTLFTVSSTGVYRMTEDRSGWKQINTSLPTVNYSKMPMAESDGKLYIVCPREIYSSNDDGVTWNFIAHRPRGLPVGLVITKDAFYLALNNRIFRSSEPGQQWEPFNAGLENRKITSVSAIGNTLFVGTDKGLFRLKSQVWEQLKADTIKSVDSMRVSENTFYVGTSPDDPMTASDLRKMLTEERPRLKNVIQWKVFRSDDLGDTWLEITPKHTNLSESIPKINIMVSGETVLAFGMQTFRSRDGGKTWTNLGLVKDSHLFNDAPSVAVDENILYKQGAFQINRSTDGGESWHRFMKGIVGTEIRDMTAFKNRLYAETGREMVYSTDGGETWTPIRIDSGGGRNFYPPIFTVTDDSFYAIARDRARNIRLCRLSDDGGELVPLPGIPTIRGDSSSNKLSKDIVDINPPSDSREQDKKPEEDLNSLLIEHLNIPRVVGMAVSSETFYLAFNRHLFRWTPGNFEWIDTGLDIGEGSYYRGFSLAASAKTVYVGRNDGHLFHSIDGGKDWKDITSILPIHFNRFNEIVFAGSAVYVATNKGVLTSESGKEWRVLTDGVGRQVVIDTFAVDGKQLYGVSKEGIYRLEIRGELELISPTVPDQVRKLTIHNDKFYIVTRDRGIFHIPLKKENR